MNGALGRRAAVVAASTAFVAYDRWHARCEASSRQPRVLITAFHDWRDVQGNVWRCRDNPSCRLLLGEAVSTPPLKRNGPLVQALTRTDISADFTFQTLPVTWGTANGLDLHSYDIVIHLGLGVYDNFRTILLENGAYNFRNNGSDALNHQGADEVIESGAQKHLKLDSAMLKRYADLRRMPSTLTTDPTFEVVEAPSRRENTYICNEVRLPPCSSPKMDPR